MRARTAALALGLGLLAAPASASAGMQTFGSDLGAAATLAEARPSDTAFWQTIAAGGSSVAVAPEAGSISSFRIKGIALSRPPAPGGFGGEPDFHLQAIRAIPSGPVETWKFRVMLTSQGFKLPQIGADPQTITTYEPINLCVAKGDVLAFNTTGGWDGTANGPYASGTPLQIFAPAPGALVSQFNGPDATNNGDILTPDHVRGKDEELLMQLTLATGGDAAGPCQPASTTPPSPGTTPAATPKPNVVVPQQTRITSSRVTVTRAGSLTVALYCSGSGIGPCSGTVRVRTRGAKPMRLASRSYSIGDRRTAKVVLRLTAAGRRRFAKAGRRLSVVVQTVTKPGGSAGTVTKAFTLRRR